MKHACFRERLKNETSAYVHRPAMFFFTEMWWCFQWKTLKNYEDKRGTAISLPNNKNVWKSLTSKAHFIWHIFEIKYKTCVGHSVFSKVTLFWKSICLDLNNSILILMNPDFERKFVCPRKGWKTPIWGWSFSRFFCLFSKKVSYGFSNCLYKGRAQYHLVKSACPEEFAFLVFTSV